MTQTAISPQRITDDVLLTSGMPGLSLATLAAELHAHAHWDGPHGTGVLTMVRDLLRHFPVATDEAENVTRLSVLEDIKSAATAAQVRETVVLRQKRVDREDAEGVPAARRGKGLGSEIALARRESPTSGSRFLGMARIMDADMPHALAALTNGLVSEFTAAMLVREVITLPAPACQTVDTHLAPTYGHLGTRALAARARALAYQAEPHIALARHEIARAERRVTVRPAADGMAYLSALIPTTHAFACKKSLMTAAATERVRGDDPHTHGTPGTAHPTESHPRSGAQMEADILVQRLTGQATPDAIPVELHVVMTDEAVFGLSRHSLTSERASTARDDSRIPDPTHAPGTPGTTHTPNTAITTGTHHTPGVSGTANSDDLQPRLTTAELPRLDDGAPIVDDDGRTADPVHASAWVPGIGPISSQMARDLLDPRHDPPPDTTDTPERVFLRRILTDPITGQITAMDTRRRAFTGTLRRALILRDDRCRTPYCGAPIVHLDHTHPYADGGRTNPNNGTSLCARCNYTKEYEGWRHEKNPKTNALTITTPTQHNYTTTTPPLLPTLGGHRGWRSP